MCRRIVVIGKGQDFGFLRVDNKPGTTVCGFRQYVEAALEASSRVSSGIIGILQTPYYKLPKSQLSRIQHIQNSLARTVVKAPKSCHITPILRSLHWLRITKRIEYKLLSLTYKVLTTTQPPYLHNLISIQRPRSTRSSSVRPPSSSSLKITDRSFRYASPCLWNQLSFLFMNLILVPVLPFHTHLFLHPSFLPLLVHHSVGLYL